MAEITSKKDFDWGPDQIKELENEIIPMVNEFIGSRK